MTIITDATWRTYARSLADDLRDTGRIRSAAWHAAVTRVPRHVLVPRYLTRQPDGTAAEHDSSAPENLPTVYSDTTLVTAYTGPQPLSSSTQPGLMLRMLESLEVHPGQRVLEIGTGTGYNAALLTERLGDDTSVVSVDVEPDLVDQARSRLAELGHHPTLLTADGTCGAPALGQFDRTIATCAVSRIPTAWIDQATTHGILLADLKISRSAGSLVRLTKIGVHTAEGRFDPVYASFMNARSHAGRRDPHFRPVRDPADATARTTTLPTATPWTALVPWFLAAMTLGSHIEYGYTSTPADQPPTSTWLATPDGSWAQIALAVDDAGGRQVLEAGPRRLWTMVEDAHARWNALGQPGWSRFGLTVDADEHTVWLDEPSSSTRWVL
ncbi:methyltransferase domain-containing protein [Amycolatopsis sp. H20-H5]|uniref:methyltransferase domain-containing protein n=1 Tax=Amycolatopsis sp. H20-H5 TaxID=3046309 RepID=UPI002DBAE60E|nr:methyltransferase domain-containing protein [Amycolatopsis sp. H20-H5]MEC3977749.1 methyltransferase domain-containing protein [Amycolatopsis sp. H20-H5]